MPKIAAWDNLPAGVRQHLIDRMRDRAITVADLNRLRLWIEWKPEVPEGDWYKDFGSFKICGHGSYPKTKIAKSPRWALLVPLRGWRCTRSCVLLRSATCIACLCRERVRPSSPN